jgi:hypothetical protein
MAWKWSRLLRVGRKKSQLIQRGQECYWMERKTTTFLGKNSLRKKNQNPLGDWLVAVAACGRLAGLRESNRWANRTPRLPSIESSPTF